MNVRIHRLGAIAAAAAGGMLLSGCNAHPGAAAYVGGQAISTTDLQGVVSRALTETQCGQQQTSGSPVLERSKLTSLIQLHLYEAVAASLRPPVRVAQGDVAAEVSVLADRSGGSLQALARQLGTQAAVAPQDVPDAVRADVVKQKTEDALTRDQVTTTAQLRAYYRQNASQYRTAHVRLMVLPDKATADSVTQKLKSDPNSFPVLIRQEAQLEESRGQRPPASAVAQSGPYLGLNQQAVVDNGGNVGLVPLSALQQSKFPTAPGSVFEFQNGSSTWNVAAVVDNQTFADVKAQVRRDMLAQVREQRFDQRLRAVVRTTPIHVNPRFGVWDSRQLAVVGGTAAYLHQPAQPAAQLQCQPQQPQQQ